VDVVVAGFFDDVFTDQDTPHLVSAMQNDLMTHFSKLKGSLPANTISSTGDQYRFHLTFVYGLALVTFPHKKTEDSNIWVQMSCLLR
jgi:hypothetical protein